MYVLTLVEIMYLNPLTNRVQIPLNPSHAGIVFIIETQIHVKFGSQTIGPTELSVQVLLNKSKN
jgi:hypothetical protein